MNTLTNMLHGALCAFLLLVLVIPGVQFTLRQLGRLRGATRRLARRTLGLEHFEKLMLDEVRSYRAVIDPRIPMTYTPEVAARVARTLPIWAQDLIGDLLRENPRSVTREELRRVKRLPLWAQQVIADLRMAR